jgi:hypothetical protein
MEKRHLAILGATGSIGSQSLDVVRQHREMFDIELLTANSNSDLLIRQAIEFDANSVVICDESKYNEVNEALAPHGIKVFCGMDSICSLVAGDNIDIVLTAIVGFSGLRPTISAIEAGKTIALANKETLVAGGEVVMSLAARYNAPILPVDSEHSAIFQCLMGAAGNSVSKILLTASGGPFREWPKERIAEATKNQALKHPQWTMGAKITIDSATMMNKGLEMIEARWLFDMKPEDIEIVIHPQSIIHSMIEFEDGAVIAQMGHPDMREPIQFALAFPHRLPLNNKKLDFASLGNLSFERPDLDRFPCIDLAFKAIERGGNITCAMNAANEAAVAAYLEDRISFYRIAEIIEECMGKTSFIAGPTTEDIIKTDEEAFNIANELIYKTK